MDVYLSIRRLTVAVATVLAVLAAMPPLVAQAQDERSDGEPPPEIVPPELLESVEALFPAGALEAGVEADVIVQIDITEAGEVQNIVPTGVVYYTWDDDGEVIEEPRAVEADSWGFVPVATDAIARYRFAPARLIDAENPDGVAIPVQVTWRIGFVAEVIEAPVDDWDAVGANDGSGAGEGSGEGLAPATEGGSGEGVRDEPGQGGGLGFDPDGVPNLVGRLLERGTRAPMGSVSVRVYPLGGDGAPSSEPLLETLSELDGRFAFRGLPPGTYRVSVRATGYFDADSDEDVVAGERTEVTYYVERNSYGEYVSRTVTSRPRREVTRTTLEVSEIQRIPGNNNDAIRVVQNLPGVARAAFGGGDVIIRGSAPEDTGFYLDDMRIPTLYHFGALRAVFPTELIETIDFYPGGHSVNYGRATGGIVSVQTNRALPERVTGHVDTNVFDTGLWLNVPIGERTAIRMGARRSYIDAILGPLAGGLGLNFTTAPRYYDAQVDVIHEFSNRHRIGLLLYTSDDLLDFVQDDQSDIDPAQRGGIRARSYFNGALLRFDSQLTDTVRNEFRAQVYNQGLGFSLGQDLYFDLATIEHSYRDTIEWRPSERYALRYGLDIAVQPGSIRIRLPAPPKEGEEALDFEASEVIESRQSVRFYQPAHFIEGEVTPIEGLTFVPGFRMEYFRPPRRWAYDPRIAVRWQATDRVLLKAAVGSFHQPPTPDETSDAFGNPDLGLEQATHYILGTELRITDRIEANVELFYKDLNQLISRSSDTTVRDGEVVPEVYNNEGIGRVYGAELLLRHNPGGKFFGWVAYTLSRSERLDGGETEWRLFDFDQTHILTMVGTYSLPRNWSVGARFRLVSGNPGTPIVGSVYDAENDTYIRVAGETNSIRSKAFHQLDLRVDKRWIFNRWTFNAYLDIQNVYNRQNQEDVVYNYDYTEQADLTGLPLIPSLGLRAEF